LDHPGRPVASAPLRLFFALWPDDAIRERLAAWAQAFHRAGGGRMMRPESVHMTLAFMGNIDARLLPAIEDAASAVTPASFTLTLDEPGFWRHNRIAWAGARTVPPALADVVLRLRAGLVAAQVPFDAKPFVPHVTLVRKARPGFRLPDLAPIVWPVRGFALVRSVTGPAGSDYAIHAEWT
jgi:2'-5' RNA ligase